MKCKINLGNHPLLTYHQVLLYHKLLGSLSNVKKQMIIMDHHLVSPLTVDVSLWPFQQNCSFASSKTLPETKSFHTPENWCTKGRCIYMIYITLLKNRPFFWGVCTVTVGVSGRGVIPMCGGNMHHIGLAILDHTGVVQVHGRQTPLHASVMDEWKNPLNAVTPTHGEIMAICDFYFKPHWINASPSIGGFSPISLQICRPKSCLSSPMFQCFSHRLIGHCFRMRKHSTPGERAWRRN